MFLIKQTVQKSDCKKPGYDCENLNSTKIRSCCRQIEIKTLNVLMCGSLEWCPPQEQKITVSIPVRVLGN
jgi:hypothetical protein